MTKYARAASLLFVGLFAGFLTAVLVLELSLRGADGTAYTQVRLIELVIAGFVVAGMVMAQPYKGPRPQRNPGAGEKPEEEPASASPSPQTSVEAANQND